MPEGNQAIWLNSGDEAFAAMLAAIDSARLSILFETYIFGSHEVGRGFREALIRARNRGLTVKVLIDSFGSYELPKGFWDPLLAVGGEMRWFNPFAVRRFEFRSHRKLMVCDGKTAFIGGFNIAKEYKGDGVSSGWRDLGMQITGFLIPELTASFDEMFAHADFKHKRFTRLRKSLMKKEIPAHDRELLLSGPGRGNNPFQRHLHHDLMHAKDVKIIVAYFLPNRRMRRDLMGVVRRGGRVQLILPSKSDVLLSQLASRSLYRRLLRAGVEIYEYQPQILHAKLMAVDDAVYVGSSNLDPRSLRINYELMVRFQNAEVASGARRIVEKDLCFCSKIELEAWKQSNSWWRILRQRWAYFLLARVDPYIARWQYRGMVN